MATNLIIKLDVKKIDKSKLYVGEKGTYLDAVILMKDEQDQYGNVGMIVQSTTKEEKDAGVKGAILGNVKWMEKKAVPGNAVEQPAPELPVTDDLPF